jgi:tRNA (cytidine56-2'-O)-methyltransferase
MDSRVTTHVCLTARALGADGVIVADRNNKTIEATITEVGGKFGGHFLFVSGQPWRKTIPRLEGKGGKVVHLNPYGLLHTQSSQKDREAARDARCVRIREDA